jgi:hypothetical protein
MFQYEEVNRTSLSIRTLELNKNVTKMNSQWIFSSCSGGDTEDWIQGFVPARLELYSLVNLILKQGRVLLGR